MSAPSSARDAYPEARDLLARIEDYWGREGWFRHGRDPQLCFAACPACKSKPLRRRWLSAGYPLLVRERDTGGYLLMALCGCPEGAIVTALDGCAHPAIDRAA